MDAGNHNDFVDGIYDGRGLVDALHPNGRCTCWGEGRCALCKQWAEQERDPPPSDGGGEPLPAIEEPAA